MRKVYFEMLQQRNLPWSDVAKSRAILTQKSVGDVAVAKSVIFLIRTGFQETGCDRDRRRHGNPLATIATDDHYIMRKVRFEVRKRNAT